MDKKTCKTCGETKDANCFPKRANRLNGKGLFHRCKACQSIWNKEYVRKNRIKVNAQRKKYRDENKEHVGKIKRTSLMKRRFRVALKSIAKMAIKRGYAPCIATEAEVKAAFTGCCHACGSREDGEHLHCIDHSHISGRFRGFLCSQCNLALGNLQDSPERIEALAEYIKKATITT